MSDSAPSPFAATPAPPYYAVIFTSLRTEGDRGYGHMADRMVELAAQQPGLLGVECVSNTGGLGITVSYWSIEEAIAGWKAHTEHKVAQETGRRVWYSDYQLRVAKVERAYGKPARPLIEELSIRDTKPEELEQVCEMEQGEARNF